MPNDAPVLEILAMSGSLREGASNTALLEAARRVAPVGIAVRMYDGLAGLPHFNPDDDGVDAVAPAPVAELRALVGSADAILMSTPEYAHGLPGAFKNALDWLVSFPDFVGKVVAIVSPSARSIHAPAQLHEVLTTMSARLLTEAPVVIQLPSRDMSPDDITASPDLASRLQSLLSTMRDTVRRE
jgi:chromate reductase, NAD(P)H dehydrogenase (quinone)